MMNGVEQLKSERYNVVMEHYQQICPDNFALQSPPVKRMKEKARQLFASALYTPQSFPFVIIYPILRVLNVLLLVYISYSIQQTCRQFNELLTTESQAWLALSIVRGQYDLSSIT